MIYIFLANGFEEIEALAVADILRRTDASTKLVGIGGKQISGAHGINFIADIAENEANLDEITGIVLPGGLPGTNNLEASLLVNDAIKLCFNKNLLIAAICAAPSILGHMGILKGKSATCYPGFEKELKNANVVDSQVCVDGNIITAKGPGAAIDFGLAVVKYLQGNVFSKKIRAQLQCI
ncbi:MAG: DJ-1/PfpI family protein [Oscillospiraceae bacterium]|jgi:4-methyl-5(b-hydroxyethyl)-thiazole monophosphate biosynthesis|nr:DJ-1/PfpI family protein [Oscillospiraceae bacterium]